jgi:Spy/CpxP family protein refolding chaperone
VIPVKLYAYAGALLAMALCLLGGGWYAHHAGYASGMAHQTQLDQKSIDAANEARGEALAQVAASAQALQQVNANSALEKLNAAVQQGRVEAAVEQLSKEKQAAQSDAATWQAKFKQASTTAACAGTLKEELCESLMGY